MGEGLAANLDSVKGLWECPFWMFHWKTVKSAFHTASKKSHSHYQWENWEAFRNQPQNSSIVCLPGQCVPRLALEIEKNQTLNSLTQIKLTYKLLPFNKTFWSYFLTDLWKAHCVNACALTSEKGSCNSVRWNCGLGDLTFRKARTQ